MNERRPFPIPSVTFQKEIFKSSTLMFEFFKKLQAHPALLETDSLVQANAIRSVLSFTEPKCDKVRFASSRLKIA